MPKGKPNARYTGEFKQAVVEDMRNNGLSQNATADKYAVALSVVQRWERIYLEDGPGGLYIERRGRANAAIGINKGRPPKLDKKVEGDLIAENQRLRMEIDYLKKLHALVRKEEQAISKKLR
ncbi:transposase [Dendrosporobacter sp. 1207_IL3150]|uniref:transposase n=1 Tax=Dendrosporobacter sp. 1207_IL3150 TaxID=3084054 RepID=UPI003FA5864D